MEYTREQYKAAIQKAVDAGNVQVANELAAHAKANLTPEPQVDVGGVGNQFLIGVGKGMTDVGRGAQDLFYRVTGNQDALSKLNEKADLEDRMYERDLGDSGAAMAGRLVGEMAATAPVGMGVGAGFKAAGAVARTGLAAATEGAISEGVTQRGSARERLIAAGQGAAFGKLADVGIQRFSRRLNKGRLDGVLERVDELDPAAQARMRQAAEDGGFTLDTAQATQENALLDRADQLVLRKDTGMAEFRAKQEQDMASKARGFINDFGDDADSFSANSFQEMTAEQMQGKLSGMERTAKSKMSGMYKAFEDAPEDALLPAPNIRQELEDFIASQPPDIVDVYGSKLRRNIEYFTEGGLTAKNSGKLIKSFNRIRGASPNGGDSVFFEELKKFTEDRINASLDEVGEDAPQILKDAREARKFAAKYYEDFQAKDVINNITARNNKADELKNNAVSTLRAVTKRGASKDLEKVRDVLKSAGDGEADKTWTMMQQLPLIHALEEAMKGGRSDAASVGFKPTNFRKVLDQQYGEKNLRVLWGDKYGEVSKALDAWSLSEVSSEARKQGLKLNPSGSAIVHNMLSVVIRLFASTGRTGQAILDIPALANVARELRNGAIDGIEAAAIQAGELPPAIRKQLQNEARAQFGEEVLQHYGTALEAIYRSSLRETMQSYRDDYSTEETELTPKQRLESRRRRRRGDPTSR